MNAMKKIICLTILFALLAIPASAFASKHYSSTKNNFNNPSQTSSNSSLNNHSSRSNNNPFNHFWRFLNGNDWFNANWFEGFKWFDEHDGFQHSESWTDIETDSAKIWDKYYGY